MANKTRKYSEWETEPICWMGKYKLNKSKYYSAAIIHYEFENIIKADFILQTLCGVPNGIILKLRKAKYFLKH